MAAAVAVDIPADVQQIDQTGCIWTLREEAADPSVIVAGAIAVAGEDEDPFLARVIDVLPIGHVTKVHLDVLPGEPAVLRRG